MQATLETARWVAAQLALAELDSSRERLARAEVRALRAQISPHFIYNALTAIASFVRTDPERARELILEFAEFTRYSFRAHGEFTTLAEELRSIDRYLTIERARFGDRLQVRLQIAPGGAAGRPAVPVPAAAGGERRAARAVPQAGRRHGEHRGPRRRGRVPHHGRGRRRGHGPGGCCVAAGGRRRPGADGGDDAGQHVGLSNVDERLRSVFGDQFGLVVETGVGAGTKVSMRVPKFHPASRAGA